ncbi:MAG: type I-C CRISPR-associated protein Cas7/Csd2 [Candidatus Omnitrophica bacterium]|nr:type I-C CRISPR-associated protein Cas7/Csd2 [Candidatus Omnitrophota bacterium]
MATPIKNRYEFVYLFDVENGNPNGDPDSGNMPRIDPETCHGLVTDVCLKRKVRNYVTLTKCKDGKVEQGFEIYVKERGILAHEQRRAYEALKIRADGDAKENARKWMCANYFDVRTFGAVMSTGKIEGEDKEKHKDLIDSKAKKPQWNCGQVRGPVQLNFSRSIDPVFQRDIAITRVALTNASDTRKEAVETDEGDKAASGQFGRKNIVHYGLYRLEGYVSAFLSEQTGFNDEDLKLLWDALINMFDHDHSAARGKMNARKLVVFRHDSALGNAPAHKLFDFVKVVRVGDDSKPARAFTDYKVEINKQAPSGVNIEDKL